MRLAVLARWVGLALCIGLSITWLAIVGRHASNAYKARVDLASAPTGSTSDELPPSATWRLVINFTGERRPDAIGAEGEQKDGTSGSGWSAVAPGFGVWSLGHRSSLTLPSIPPGPAVVAIELEPFLAPGLPVQRLAIRAGSQTLGQWRIEGAKPKIVFSLPESVRGPTGVELIFDLPDADSPAHRSPGATDVRRLAVALKRVTVTG